MGLGLAYTPGARDQEIIEVFRAANRHAATCFVHVRVSDWAADQELAATEVIALSAVTGSPLHILHIQEHGPATPRVLRMIGDAQVRGLDVTTEVYPYKEAEGRIETVENDNWRSWPDEWFHDTEWVKTRERLTRESFERYRKQGGAIVIHNEGTGMEAVIDNAVVSPLTIISSDGGIYPDGRGHPRSAGTHALILGRYVRERRPKPPRSPRLRRSRPAPARGARPKKCWTC